MSVNTMSVIKSGSPGGSEALGGFQIPTSEDEEVRYMPKDSLRCGCLQKKSINIKGVVWAKRRVMLTEEEVNIVMLAVLPCMSVTTRGRREDNILPMLIQKGGAAGATLYAFLILPFSFLFLSFSPSSTSPPVLFIDSSCLRGWRTQSVD